MSVQNTEDFSIDEKMRFEEDLIGIIFSSTEGSPCELCGYLNDVKNEDIIFNQDIYRINHFVLYVSLISTDFEKISRINDFLSEKGNCSVEIYFSDTRQKLQINGKINLNDLNFYRIRLILKEIPFYISIR